MICFKQNLLLTTILLSTTLAFGQSSAEYQLPMPEANADSPILALPAGQPIKVVLKAEALTNNLTFEQQVGESAFVIYSAVEEVQLMEGERANFTVSYTTLRDTVVGVNYSMQIPDTWEERDIADFFREIAIKIKDDYFPEDYAVAPVSNMGSDNGDLKYCFTPNSCMRTRLMRDEDRIVITLRG